MEHEDNRTGTGFVTVTARTKARKRRPASTTGSVPGCPVAGLSDSGVVLRLETSDTLHGRKVHDPYQWLEDPGSANTGEWLTRQQDLFATHRRRWKLRSSLHDRIAVLLETDTWSPPCERSQRLFATQRAPSADHPQLVVIQDGTHRVLLDPVVVDPTGNTVLDRWEPSPDGSRIAVQLSRHGRERGELAVYDVATGEVVDSPIRGVRYSPVAWLDNHSFYYVRAARDSTGVAVRRGVWLHQVGSPPERDVLIHVPTGRHITAPHVRVDHERWLLVWESHGTGYRTDVWLAELNPLTWDSPVLREVQRDIEANTEAWMGRDSRLYLRTTLGASRGRLCWADPAVPRQWHELIAEDEATTLDAFGFIESANGVAEILAVRSRQGIAELSAHDPASGALLRRVALPGEGMVNTSTAQLSGNAAYLSYADVSQPPSVVSYRRGDVTVRPWRAPVPAPRTTIRRNRREAITADGTAIPVTVLSAWPPGAPRPTILHAYGSYGRVPQFGFSASLAAWVEAGGQYVVAHVRGGADAGRDWHMQARRARKAVAVDDLITVAEWLHHNRYTTPEHLCLSGGSAGGLLVLAAAVRRPELWNAVIALAPLADMIRFERFGIGAHWTEEFGSVTDPDDFAALLAYSPYHNVRPGTDYPATLLIGFHEDTRTGAQHPRKMCAALQGATTGDRPVLLRYSYQSGHGPKPLSQAVGLAADAHAFAAFWTGLGINRDDERRTHHARTHRNPAG
ncbi:MAG: prolyl oligopeptidase family serine peptidase [Pseudonocardiaceae bacterium]